MPGGFAVIFTVTENLTAVAFEFFIVVGLVIIEGDNIEGIFCMQRADGIHDYRLNAALIKVVTTYKQYSCFHKFTYRSADLEIIQLLFWH